MKKIVTVIMLLTVAMLAAGTVYGAGYQIDPAISIRAKIHTVEKGIIEAVWKKGSEDETTDRSRVIWGYFYADPDDVAWGSSQNPDVFVKIWFDKSGHIDVNFFHVSVPDIDVYSEYYGENTLKASGTATMDRRYIRHTYRNGALEKEEKYENGSPPSGYEPSGSPSGDMTINDLKIGAIIRTVEKGPVDAVWRKGGGDCTTDGNQVIWGHFYADPDDVGWGSPSNPEVFVKIWFDVSGRVDVNFFHVSVPDIEVYSDLPIQGTYDQKGTTILDNRYIRHEYRRNANDKKSPVANFTAELTKKDAPYEVTLDASDSCDYDGNIVKYEWKNSAEPGKTWQGEIVVLSLPSAGTYTFTLTASDDDGLKDSQIQEAVILPSPPGIFNVEEIILTAESPGEDCNTPPTAETAFDETDTRVIAWVQYAYFEAGKIYEFKWYAPGVAEPVHTYTSPPKNAVWNGCSWISIPVATLQRYPSGTWRVEFYYDGEKSAEKNFDFHSDSPGSDFQLEDFIMTAETAIDEECLKPGEQKSFDDTDTAANVWAYYRNFEAGKNYEFRWYTPKNVLAYKNQGSFEENGDGGCLLGSMKAEVLRGYGSGEWRVEFYYDGKKYAQSNFTFTTSAAPSPFKVNKLLFTGESPNAQCEAPDSETVFDDTDTNVTVWVQYENFEGTKGPYRFVWYSPDGQLAQETSESSSHQETENLSAGCAWESMTAEQIAMYDPGQWRVKFYYAGEEYSEGYFTFNLTQPRPFSITEFIFTLDTPSNDCDKVLNPGSSFDDTDDTVYARISHMDFQTGKPYQIKWYDPHEKLIHSQAGTHEEISDRAGCIWSGVPAKKLRESGSGWWRVEFYYDGKLYREESFYFTSSNSDKVFEAREFVITGSYSQDNNCLTPSSKTVFDDSDAGAVAWVYYYFFEEGKFYDFKWYAPDNTLVQTSTRETQKVENLTSGCIWSSISAEKLREYGSGEWEVEFYYDDQLKKTATFTFETAHTALEISKFVLTNETPGGNNCTSPASETDFDDFDGDSGKVFAWVRYSRFEPGKSYWFKWYSPENELAQESNPHAKGDISAGCLWEGISVTTLQRYQSGSWRVEFYYDGHMAEARNFTFTSQHPNEFEITEFVLTTVYTENCEIPSTETSFSEDDAEVIAWIYYRNLKAGVPYAFKWYNPAGESVQTNAKESGSDKDVRIGCTWASISKAALKREEPGKWRVELVYNDKKYGEAYFDFTYSQKVAIIELKNFFFAKQSRQDTCEEPEAETAFTESDAGVTAWVSYHDLEGENKSYQFKWYSPDNTLAQETEGVSESGKNCVWESISAETLSLYDPGQWRVEFYYDGKKYSEENFAFSSANTDDAFSLKEFLFTASSPADNCEEKPVSEEIVNDNDETVAAWVSHSGFQPGKQYEFRWFTSDNVLRYIRQGTHTQNAACSWAEILPEQMKEYGSDTWRVQFYYDGTLYGEKEFQFVSGNPTKAFTVSEILFAAGYSQADNCQPPSSETVGNASESGITAWVHYDLLEAGKPYEFRWYAPDNTPVQSELNSQPGGNLISGCLWSSISAEKIGEYAPGEWLVGFYYDGYLQRSAEFTVYEPVIKKAEIEDFILTLDGPPENDCSRPVPETEFDDFSGNTVFAWLRYKGFEADKSYQFRWYNPENISVLEAGMLIQGPAGCLWTGIPAEKLRQYGYGTWRIAFFYDGEKKAEQSFTFTFLGFQMTDFVLTDTYSDGTSCNIPASRSTFTDKDSGVTAWMSYGSFETQSKPCKFIWYSPDGTRARETEAVIENDVLRGCVWDRISKETLMMYDPGQWRAEFYYDGEKYSEIKFIFALSYFRAKEFLITAQTPSDCNEHPVPEMIFDDANDTVFAWMSHFGFQSGKLYEFRWYNSDEVLCYASQGTHENMRINGCSWDGIPIEKLREYGSDLWRVEFYYDGELYGEDNFYFNSGNPDQAFEAGEILFTEARDSQGDGCQTSTAKTVFNSNAPGVAAGVRYYFFEPEKSYEFKWYAPDNTLVQSGARYLQETDGLTGGCLESEISVEELREYGTGTWRAEFYYDNQLQNAEAFTFEADSNGPQIETFILTDDPPDGANCVSPVPETDFDGSGGDRVFAWIRYQGFEPGIAYQFRWYSPENVLVYETNPSSVDTSGTGCLWTEISTMTLREYPSGDWRAAFYYGGEKIAERFFTFTSQDFQVSDFMLTDTYSGETCETPVPRNTFTDKDSQVSIWLAYQHFEMGKSCKFLWYTPDGTLAQKTERTVQRNFETGCLWERISSETLAIYESGEWRVEFYYDGKKYAGQTFAFSLSFKIGDFLFTLDTPSEECSPPHPGTLFVDNDGTVSAWVSCLNAEAGKEAEFRWYNPDDAMRYAEKVFLDENTGCLWSEMTTETLREYGSGWWRAEFFYDGIQYDAKEFFFTSDNPAKEFEVWEFRFTGTDAETEACEAPPPQTSFDDSDPNTVVTAWARYYFSEPGKSYDFRWYSPDKTLVQSDPQAFEETDSLRSGCVRSEISAQKLWENGSGKWRVEFYYDDQLYAEGAFTSGSLSEEYPQIRDLAMTTAYSQEDNCETPAAQAEFSDTDSGVIAWVSYQYFRNHAPCEFIWYSPDGSIAQINPEKPESGKDGCMWVNISKDSLKRYPPGQWRVEFHYNGRKLGEQVFDFQF